MSQPKKCFFQSPYFCHSCNLNNILHVKYNSDYLTIISNLIIYICTQNKIINVYLLPVLMYHSIIGSKKEKGKHNIYVLQGDLERQLAYLHKNQYQTITFEDLAQNPQLDTHKKVILTFDDGYEDNYTRLFPLLKKYNFKAVIYLVTQEDHNSWGVKEGEPRKNLMTDMHIKEMSDYGIEFGGHTQHHPVLHDIDEASKRKEIGHCKSDIEKKIGKEVVSFAYPFGAISDEIKKITKEAGYTFGIATKNGPLHWQEDFFHVRRIEIATRTTFWGFKRKVSGKYLTHKFFI